MVKVNVKVMTFKESGKYYDEWEIEVEIPKDTWYEIIKAVKEYKQSDEAIQKDMLWLIGVCNSDRDDSYPVLIKN